jgi:queuine tRNA-ribosyltransferase
MTQNNANKTKSNKHKEIFTITHTDSQSQARVGILKIGTKIVNTPFFMPVATKAAIKALTTEQLKETKTECIISNGFILALKPGTDIIKAHGGIHNFMKWDGASFTDSGGFQVLLDEFFIKRDPNGIVFKNPFTGQKELFDAARSIQMQNDIGSDVAMAFDDVSRYGYTHEQSKQAMLRSLIWAKESLTYHRNNNNKTNKNQIIFGICHGNVYEDLRLQSVLAMKDLDFDGFAIGGVAIGESTQELYDAIKIQAPHLPTNKPRYVMGLGSPADLLEAISMGCDCFDSIFPTQNARRATLFTSNGPLRIITQEHKLSTKPIDEKCDCYTCRHFSRSYVHMLLNTHEYLGYTLASIHNITYIQNIMQQAREHITKGTFGEFKKQIQELYQNKRKSGGDYFHYAKEEKSIDENHAEELMVRKPKKNKVTILKEKNKPATQTKQKNVVSEVKKAKSRTAKNDTNQKSKN